MNQKIRNCAENISGIATIISGISAIGIVSYTAYDFLKDTIVGDVVGGTKDFIKEKIKKD